MFFIIPYTYPLTMLTVGQRKKITVVTFIRCPAVVLTRRPTKRRSVTCQSSNVAIILESNSAWDITHDKAGWLIQDIGILAWLPRRTSDSKPSYPTGLANSLKQLSYNHRTPSSVTHMCIQASTCKLDGSLYFTLCDDLIQRRWALLGASGHSPWKYIMVVL